MTAMVALLRGINVGGTSVISMADVRQIATECGYGNVGTYVQSGNLVFTASQDPDEVAATLRTAFAESSSVEPEVIVRTQAELHEVVAANPFLDRDAEPKQLQVVFMPGNEPASVAGVDLESFAPEAAAVVGRELYMYLPNGMGRSKLAAALMRKSGTSGTARNWRTVTKLAAMADEAADL
ncbi:DUF1697 domain-containing protein [Natronoglycomyces albus]|uniref:DUF1697 domain-containing protein n=1 Tax=Natronoglycomyces albus TaxID=2811108 RepID=A0A895XJI9_9ACTN|nr:DUF1697 domain-containing protein [Natronoglycomyces albus]QSB05167.1 DUF1697 domain-containing protein [Natronoglycomyces albus]